MKHLLLVFPLLFAVAASRVSAEIVDDIITLAEKGLSQEVLIAFVDQNVADLRDLKAADIARMMDARVPDRVVEAVLRRQYGMPPEGASQANKPQESTAQEPQTSQTEEPATPPQSEDNVTYVTDTSCPVPIFYEAPVFAFGVDVFGYPHLHHRFDSFHHHGDSFSFNPQTEYSNLGGHMGKLPHYGWTSNVPPSAQSPRPHPGTGHAGAPIAADIAPDHATVERPAHERSTPEHSTVAPVHATHSPSQSAPAPVQAPVAHETHSSSPSSSGNSYSQGSSVQEHIVHGGHR